MINYLQKQLKVILVELFYKPNIKQINQIKKISNANKK